MLALVRCVERKPLSRSFERGGARRRSQRTHCDSLCCHMNAPPGPAPLPIRLLYPLPLSLCLHALRPNPFLSTFLS